MNSRLNLERRYPQTAHKNRLLFVNRRTFRISGLAVSVDSFRLFRSRRLVNSSLSEGDERLVELRAEGEQVRASCSRTNPQSCSCLSAVEDWQVSGSIMDLGPGFWDVGAVSRYSMVKESRY